MIPCHVHVAFFIIAASWLFSIIQFRNLRFDLRIPAGYLTACMLMGSIQYLYALRHGNNLWLSHLFAPMELGILAWLLSLWEKDSSKRHGMQLFTILFETKERHPTPHRVVTQRSTAARILLIPSENTLSSGSKLTTMHDFVSTSKRCPGCVRTPAL